MTVFEIRRRGGLRVIIRNNESKLKLLPRPALDFGPGVVAGAAGDYDGCLLFARPTAGKAELIVGGLFFHE
jgi:hypothetical protein